MVVSVQFCIMLIC